MKKFARKIEDFVCENCGTKVVGDGYTNHCPNCLHSKHVDINPGDRACGCCGLMEPVEIQQKNGEFVILHRCKKCGFERRNRVSERDNYGRVLEISGKRL